MKFLRKKEYFTTEDKYLRSALGGALQLLKCTRFLVIQNLYSQCFVCFGARPIR